MEKNIKIVQSPFASPMGVVGDIVIVLHVPYSDKMVTVKINPSVDEYKENMDQPGIKVRQMMVNKDTDETKILTFDFAENNVHKVNVRGKDYEIKLLNIGAGVGSPNFKSFEFLVKS